jgi:hypothetical protein
VLSQMNPVHILTSYFFVIHFNIVFPSLSISPKWSPSSKLSNQIDPALAPLLSFVCALWHVFNFVGTQVLLLPSQLLLQVVSFQDQSNGWGTSLPQLLQQVQVLSQLCHPLLPLLQDELRIFLSISVPIH